MKPSSTVPVSTPIERVTASPAHRAKSAVARDMLAAILATVLLTCGVARAADTLVPFGATWRYLDDGSDQGTGWSAPLFDDSSWASGPAELGYGDGDEATVVGFGPNPSNKFITTYFRHDFAVADASVYLGAELRLVRDDGARVFLNGVEIARSILPSGPIGYRRLATTAMGGSSEEVENLFAVDPSLLVTGTNTLAIEIHQASVSSSDISLDAALVGYTQADGIELRRGPYLQSGSESRVTVRWRTQIFTDARVRYGLDPGDLTQTVTDPALSSEHTVDLTGLSADTTYYYEIGTTAGDVLAGGDMDHFFRTAPVPGDRVPTRVWAIGDSGTADANAAAVRDAYLALPGSDATNLWLMLGDNAYDDGTDNEYQSAVFDMYSSLLRQSVVWPTLGNHDARSAESGAEFGVYYDIFRLPTAGESGGLASGTEAYYSFDFANIHFVCLDSQDSNRFPAGAMLTWLENDLASTMQDWIIAFWHHPPYTKGSHDSDSGSDSGGRMVQMRVNALPILEAAGVDLVLSGHSHSYERSFLLNGHYGPSTTLAPSMILDSGDGRPEGDGAYAKETPGLAGNEGAVYIVAGSSGKTSSGPLNHPAMFVSVRTLGSVVLDIEGLRMDVRFLRENGQAFDTFTLYKGDPGTDSRAFTATFADGTLGGLRETYGTHSIAGEGLEASTAGFDVPSGNGGAPVLYSGASMQTEIAAGMPAGSWAGFRVRAASTADRFTPGGGDAFVQAVHDGAGNIRPRVFYGGGLVASGSSVAASADTSAVRLRMSFAGGRARCFVNDTLALDHAVAPTLSGTVSLHSFVDASNPGTVRFEYVTIRDGAAAPDVFFDSEGRQWLALARDDLRNPFDPASFEYREGDISRDWPTFQTEILPQFDRIEAMDDHILILGRTAPGFTPGLITGLAFEGRDDESSDR